MISYRIILTNVLLRRFEMALCVWRHLASWGSARLEKRMKVKGPRDDVTEYLPSPLLSVNEIYI